MINTKEKALALIEKELAKKDIPHTENEVEDVLDALYEAYEADDTVPTQEAFAEQCANVEVGETVLAMKRDPFVKRSKGPIIAICVGCILAVALIGGICYTVADQQQDDLAVESTVVSDTDKADDAAETSEDDETDEDVEADGEETDEEQQEEDDTSTSSDASSSSTSSSTTSSTSSSSSSSNSTSSSSSSSSHSHNWVAQTKTVHHDAVYETVYHSAVKEEKVLCNGCGAQFDSDKDWASHSKSNILQGCGSYTVKSVVTQQAYTEQVLVTAAYDETVTTGYKCSTCGATK